MDITHLLHWENAESFTVIQVAHLIRGLDPSLNGEYDESKVQHIIEAMRRAYAHARGCCANLMTKGGYGYSDDKPHEYPLFSIELHETEKQNLHKACFFGNAGDKLDWLNPENNQNLDFEDQRFYHYQVANWLKGSRIHSVYPFDACFVDDRGSYVDESQIQPARFLSPSEVLDLVTPDTPAPEIKVASPAPVVVTANTPPPSTSEAVAPAWSVIKPDRFRGYNPVLYQILNAAYIAGLPCPTAREVLEQLRVNKPIDVIAEVLHDQFKYYDINGNTRIADLDAIRKAIKRMVSGR